MKSLIIKLVQHLIPFKSNFVSTPWHVSTYRILLQPALLAQRGAMKGGSSALDTRINISIFDDHLSQMQIEEFEILICFITIRSSISKEDISSISRFVKHSEDTMKRDESASL